jgi:hypothetical protein
MRCGRPDAFSFSAFSFSITEKCLSTPAGHKLSIHLVLTACSTYHCDLDPEYALHLRFFGLVRHFNMG